MRSGLLLAPLLLASCAASDNQAGGLDQDPPGPRCTPSEALNGFIGQPASTELGARLMATSRAQTLRWVPHGAVITMDFSPTRLTVRLDEQNRVESATCG